MAHSREANFRRVLGVLFEDMRLDTPAPEDLSVDRLMATSAGKPTNLAPVRWAANARSLVTEAGVCAPGRFVL
jgi:hypothetical protein